MFHNPDPKVLTQSSSYIHDQTLKPWTLGGYPTFTRQGKIPHNAKDSSQNPEYIGLTFPIVLPVRMESWRCGRNKLPLEVKAKA